MESIIKAGEVDPKIAEALAAHGTAVEVGDMFINNYGDVLRIEGFRWHDYHYNKPQPPTPILHVRIFRRGRNGEWSSYGDTRIEEFARHLSGSNPDYVKLYAPIEELEARSIDEMLRLEAEYLSQNQQEAAAGTSLTLRHSKEHLEAIRDSIDAKRNRITVTKRLIERKVRAMQYMAEGLYKQLQYVTKIIEVGELYLGIREQIYHIRQGEPAPIGTPITFHQLVLYMDEEAGDIEWRGEHQGIDFQSIEAFDEWLLKDNHVDTILPEPKGIVFLKVTRQERDYHPNPFFNAEMKAKNRRAYALIKNGGNVYRIWTVLPLETRLFPSNEEWAMLEEGEVEDSTYAARSAFGIGGGGTTRKDADGAEKRTFSYRRNMALVQGLLDRTEVFQPMPGIVNLFDLDSYEGMIQLIRDDEPSLTSGRLSYRDWKKALNSVIQRGSRVFLAPIPRHYRSDDGLNDRYLVYYRPGNLPPAPAPGVYSVEEVLSEKDLGQFDEKGKFRILYNPKDEVLAGGWGSFDYHERKKSISFLLNPSDPFVLNYDGLDIDEIDYHISNRRERRHYLDMLPVLHGIRLALIEERAYEQEFARLLQEKHGYPLEAIQEAIQWWKDKVIWKRPIGKDDAKAWRMIKRRLNKQEGD